MNPKSPSRLAFTLIELLVVIAIILVLAALLFPALSRIQDTANGTKCASNLKQIGAAMITFAVENSGSFPISGGQIAYTGSSSPSAWTRQLEKYLGTTATSTAIFTCPSTSKLPSTSNQKTFSYFNGSHAADYDTTVSPPQFTGYAAVRQALIQYPSKYILAGDVTGNFPDMPATDANKDNSMKDPAFDSATSLPNLPKIHNGKANILFADGHVAGFATFDYSKAGTDSDTRSMTVWYDRVADYNGKE